VNPWHDVRLLNATANALMALAMCALLSAGIWWLAQRPAFALQIVRVEAISPQQPLTHITAPLLRSAASGPIRGTFFTVDLEAVRESFETVPWVRRAEVRRIWPNTLLVGIEEHRPLAIWGDGRLVNREGELFVANPEEAEADQTLVAFSGPPGSEADMTRRWRELNEQLAPLNLTIESLTLSPRHAWTARFDNGLTLVLGREQDVSIASRIERWVSAYPLAQARLSREAVSVDLRYPNGFAVRAPGALDQAPRKPAAMRAVTTPKGATPRATNATLRPSTARRTP
jgi:cell division protein FtsQ